MTYDDVENALFCQRVQQCAREMGLGVRFFLETFYSAEVQQDYDRGKHLLRDWRLVSFHLTPFNASMLEQLKAQHQAQSPWLADGEMWYALALR